jgi:nucleotide-binding universal stress UspA family protein
MQNVLVPTDFSDSAMKAAIYATETGRSAHATIHLLHVIEVPERFYSEGMINEDVFTRSLHDTAMMQLSGLKEIILAQNPDLKVSLHVTEGSIHSGICETAEKLSCDVIIMGTSGATGLQEAFFGSKTAKTISCAKTPVIVIPGDYAIAPPATILLAASHFEENTLLLSPVIQLARLYKSEVHVIVFVEKDKASVTDYVYNTHSVYSFKNTLSAKYPDIHFTASLLDGTDFEGALSLYETRNRIDLLAMITYPKSLFERLTRKSVTKKLAMHSKIPILAIPAEMVNTHEL